MAREIIIRMTSDFDRTKEADEVLTFVYDGMQYEVDCGTHEGEEFRTFLQTYMDVAHESIAVKVEAKSNRGGSRPGHHKTQVRSPEGESTQTRQAIREWARQNGFPDIPIRGLIKQEVRDAYAKAHPDVAVMPNVRTDPKVNDEVLDHPQLDLEQLVDESDPIHQKNVNGVSQDMRDWAKLNNIPIARGYLKRLYRDQYYREKAADIDAMAKLNGAHV